PLSPKASRKLRRERRRELEALEGIDYVGLLRAAGAAVLLLGVSLGFAAPVPVAVRSDREGPAGPIAQAPPPAVPEPRAPVRPEPGAGVAAEPRDPPRKKADEPKKDLPPKETPWTARPDPPAQPPRQWDFPPGPGVPLNGNPLFASGGGPFLTDTPEVGLNFN